eukprot:scaffold59035_cov63-Phaeocystis_antarctica.AAC.3
MQRRIAVTPSIQLRSEQTTFDQQTARHLVARAMLRDQEPARPLHVWSSLSSYSFPVTCTGQEQDVSCSIAQGWLFRPTLDVVGSPSVTGGRLAVLGCRTYRCDVVREDRLGCQDRGPHMPNQRPTQCWAVGGDLLRQLEQGRVGPPRRARELWVTHALPERFRDVLCPHAQEGNAWHRLGELGRVQKLLEGSPVLLTLLQSLRQA